MWRRPGAAHPSPPLTIPQAGDLLAEASREPAEVCRRAIEAVLRAGADARHPELGRPLFAFRLHQFLSKGDTVYVSFEPPGGRHLTSQYQTRVPDHLDKPLVPLHFCRDCGKEYLVVTRPDELEGERFEAREDPDAPASEGDGFLYVSDDRPWPDEHDQDAVLRRLPASWVETDDDGQSSVLKARAGDLPEEVWIGPDGRITESGTGLRAWWVGAPFRFCLHCRTSYEQLRLKDLAKLGTFSAEGRSSAVSLISSRIVRSLRAQPELKKKARKLLTFVDNRQDASLQAGHFNDFALVTQVRGALYRALDTAGERGLTFDRLPQAVFDALCLPMEAYARVPGANFHQRDLAHLHCVNCSLTVSTPTWSAAGVSPCPICPGQVFCASSTPTWPRSPPLPSAGRAAIPCSPATRPPIASSWLATSSTKCAALSL
ncbi:hypothetical protein [Streptomyces sp. BPTC-684]|uniref:hypothetical protein n=1 Tax=Streptomyces sp. BPTC-684 TaxID=3043734 RepID=UPI0024B186E2|nr:hypothetical protein [Streptomyces sp. BPTC-684]WHM41553.1 hypothetical protein QIY60_22575 [Streptomyces sp. BPTC-684]